MRLVVNGVQIQVSNPLNIYILLVFMVLQMGHLLQLQQCQQQLHLELEHQDSH